MHEFLKRNRYENLIITVMCEICVQGGNCGVVFDLRTYCGGLTRFNISVVSVKLYELQKQWSDGQALEN